MESNDSKVISFIYRTIQNGKALLFWDKSIHKNALNKDTLERWAGWICGKSFYLWVLSYPQKLISDGISRANSIPGGVPH